MDDKIVDLGFVAGRECRADTILDKAKNAGLKHVIVLGWDADSDFFMSTSYATGPEILWLLEGAKMALLEMAQKD